MIKKQESFRGDDDTTYTEDEKAVVEFYQRVVSKGKDAKNDFNRPADYCRKFNWG